MKLNEKKVEIGDRLMCLVMSDGEIVPVEHLVTKLGFSMFGIRIDTMREVPILATSILGFKMFGESNG